ncbi:MAG: hypothetical protein ACXWNY_13765 [Gemmatimonadaceae bacterium]
MSKSSGFDRGVLAGMLIAFGAFSVNWLITPAQHPDASTLRTIGVVAQAVLGIGIGVWMIVRERSLQKRQAAAVNTP